MIESNIKLEVILNQEQTLLFHNSLFATQMWRNHSVVFLKKRSKERKAWIKQNLHNPDYLAFLEKQDLYIKELKKFNKDYPTKQARDLAKTQGKAPYKPQVLHPLLNSQEVSLNEELTLQLNKAKAWLMKNISVFEATLQANGILLPKTNPQNFCVFFNSLPFSVRKSLQAWAKNESVLLYLLASPRSCLAQVSIDLMKTYKKAYENLKQDQPKQNCGFPCFKKVERVGGMRFQLDPRHKTVCASWQDQQIQTSEFGSITWQDGGYILPESPAKMITLKKETNGRFYVTFFGKASYNEKRLEQKQRSQLKRPVLQPANSLEEFFDQQSVAIDLNRHQGQIKVVTNIEQKEFLSQEEKNLNVKNYTLSLYCRDQEAKILKKNKRKEKRLKFFQSQVSKKDSAKKKNKGKKKNPNGLHRNSKHSKRRTIVHDKMLKTSACLTRGKDSYLRALVQKLTQGKTVIFAEKLQVFAMFKRKDKSKKKRRNENKSQGKASFAKFMSMLEEECLKNNIVLLRCGTYDPTSQLCHSCGYDWGKIDTDVRAITCKSCGATHDRDYNSTQNIKYLALYRYYEYLTGDKEKALLNNIEKLEKNGWVNPNLKIKTNKSLAESVNAKEVVVYNNLFDISHEKVLSFIQKHYPLDKVLLTIEKRQAWYLNKQRKDSMVPKDATCRLGHRETPVSCRTYHPVFSKTGT